MTRNSGNQIKNKMIKTHALTDVEKLAGLERFIHLKYPEVSTMLQPYLLFTKGEDRLVKCDDGLRIDEVSDYNIGHPDMIIHEKGKRKCVFELDGSWHKLPPGKHDVTRNKRYELNNIPYIVINESELKLKLDVPKTRSLTQDQINKEFKERFDNL